MSSRLTVPVLEFPLPLHLQDPALLEALELLKAATGKVHPLGDVTLISVIGGHGLTAAGGAGTSLVAGTTVIDFSEISVDEARIMALAGATTANATLQVYDVTNGVAICSVVLVAGAAALFTGEWTAVDALGGDRQLELRVIGNGVNTQTLHSVHFQFRTTRFTP